VLGHMQELLHRRVNAPIVQVAFIGGVADSSGYGWAIAKQLANAGATIIVGTWPPVLSLFERGIKKGFGEDSKLIDGSDMVISKVFFLCGSPLHTLTFLVALLYSLPSGSLAGVLKRVLCAGVSP